MLGYFGADPDVLELLGAGDTVWWLVREGDLAKPRHGAPRLGVVREARVVAGAFDDLLDALGRPRISMGDGRRLDEPTANQIRAALDPAQCRAALAELTFRALTASAGMRDLDDVVARSVRTDGNSLGDQAWRARGIRARYRGGALWWPLWSAACFLRAALSASGSTRLKYLSDALDAIEMVGLGLVTPFARLVPSVLHADPATSGGGWHQRSGFVAAMACFRVGRSALFCWSPRHAEAALSAALERREGNMVLGGIAYRWRAQARARLKDSRWRQDIAAARELLVFEDRQQELADLLRAEGSCRLVAEGDVAGHAD